LVETKMREFNGQSDQVHLLVVYPPKVSNSHLVNSVKGVSSRCLRQQFLDLERRYRRGHRWSASYFAGSVGGTPLDVSVATSTSSASPERQVALRYRTEGRRSAPQS
jgi:REP element-mobilizing transposase RayT